MVLGSCKLKKIHVASIKKQISNFLMVWEMELGKTHLAIKEAEMVSASEGRKGVWATNNLHVPSLDNKQI